MIGYIIANQQKLNEQDRKYYQACYCGLCKSLGENHNIISRITLNYDITFVLVVLSSIYTDEFIEKPCKCVLHPKRNKMKYMEELLNMLQI